MGSTSRCGSADRPRTVSSNRAGVILLALATLQVIGCGEKSAFEVVPTHGSVKVDGVPLGGGRIVFAPVARDGVNSGKVAHGILDAEGSFSLTTYKENDGAVVGEHWVTIYRRDDEIIVPASQPAAARIPKFSRLPLPQKTVIAGGEPNQIEISLTAAEVSRLGVK